MRRGGMPRHGIWPLMALLLLAAACSDSGQCVPEGQSPLADATAYSEFVNGDELPVSFSVTGGASTRSGGGDGLDGDFKVYAWYHDDADVNPYMGGAEVLWVGADAGSGYYAGDRVAEDAETGYWHTTGDYYWPRSWLTTDFYALYPYSVGDLRLAGEGAAAYRGVDLRVPQDNAGELLYSYLSTNVADRDHVTGGAVTLTFNHALSQVAFVGKTTNAGWHVSISGLSLHNVLSSGTFDLKAGCWKDQTTNRTYNLTLESETISLSGDDPEEERTKALTATAQPRLLIGQRLTAWDPTEDTIDDNDAPDGPKGCYLRLTCLITSTANGSEENILPANGTPIEIYVPFTNVGEGSPNGWQPGKHYIYTLNFGGGYDADGNVNIVPVTMTTSITDWNSEGIAAVSGEVTF